MSILGRENGEQIVLPSCQSTVALLRIQDGRVRLGISAPPGVAVRREEALGRTLGGNCPDFEEHLAAVHVLIADTDDFLLDSYGQCLRERGAVVATATTGLECVERLRDFVPDVLVLDSILPWGHADGVLAVIHEEPQIRPSVVILLAQGCDRSLLYRLSQFQIDDCHLKPLSAQQLEERISTLIVSQTN